MDQILPSSTPAPQAEPPEAEGICAGCWRFCPTAELAATPLGLCAVCTESRAERSAWMREHGYIHANSLSYTDSRFVWSEVGWFIATLLLLCAIVALGCWEAFRP